MPETWALQIVLVLATVQLLAVLYFYRYRRTESPSDSTTADPAAETSSIECSVCGAENDPEYRYCRRCIADLSPDSVSGHSGHALSGRSF